MGRRGPDTPERAASVSEQGFVDLFARSSRVFWCLAAAVLGRPDAVEDVLQEAALTAMGKLDDLVDPEGFEAWMGQIVRFTALNARRRRERDKRVPGDSENDPTTELPARPCDPLPVIADDGQLLAGQDAFDDQVQGALGTLEEVPRACLLLKVVMELGYREIGRLLDIPEGTAMSHVHRSRKRMKAQLWAVEGRADIRRMGS